MKKWTGVYLWILIIVFILILIPYFQNAGGGGEISFYFMSASGITGIYLWVISLGMIEGILITLYLQSLFKDIKEWAPTKFELNQ